MQCHDKMIKEKGNLNLDIQVSLVSIIVLLTRRYILGVLLPGFSEPP